MNARTPKSVGLGGDGDEIWAIQALEKAFGITLDYSDAPQWHTAGDVYASLCKALPIEEKHKTDVWERFTSVLSQETGVDPKSIEADSPLLSQPSLPVVLANINAVIWIAVAIGVAACMAWILLR
jgi:hypothetical protein